jgi:hypothetical protein
MLVDKIIDPILVLQTVNTVLLRYVVVVELVLLAESLRFGVTTYNVQVVDLVDGDPILTKFTCNVEAINKSTNEELRKFIID